MEYIDNIVKKKNIKGLFAIFFNLSHDDDEYFYVKSLYKTSKFSEYQLNQYITNEINHSLSNFFGLDFQVTGSGAHIIKIKKTNDIKTHQELTNEVYRQIQLLGFSIDSHKYEQDMIMSLFMLRGSADFSGQFYTVDIKEQYVTSEYLNRLFQLLSGVKFISQLNFNFRELQPQYSSGENQRSAQLRINLGFFWQEYEKYIREINIYKYDILNSNSSRIKPARQSFGNFSDRLIEYTNNILGKADTDEIISRHRNNLGLDKKSTDHRNQNLRYIATRIMPDECMGCCGVYPRSDRTFKIRNSQLHYFEIHHIIPFSSGKEHDQIDNLSKLCPTCHRALTKGRADEELQKSIIRNILCNHDHGRNYVKIIINSDNEDDQVNFVYKSLV